jgi:hypothetical protein
MIATGFLSAMSGSTIGDSENSTNMILIVDAGSMKRGNFTDVILIVGVDLTTDVILTVGENSTEDAILIAGVGSGRIGAAILTAARRIGAEDIKVTEVVDAITDEDKCKVG